MKKRWKEYQEEIRELEIKLTFIKLSEWFQQWAIYIAKGGVRPDKPH